MATRSGGTTTATGTMAISTKAFSLIQASGASCVFRGAPFFARKERTARAIACDKAEACQKKTWFCCRGFIRARPEVLAELSIDGASRAG